MSNCFWKEWCRIVRNKPIYIGTSILDLSKALIQDFHYEYGDQVEVFLADTNSLMNKLKLKMFMKNSTKIISYLTSIIIKKIKILHKCK